MIKMTPDFEILFHQMESSGFSLYFVGGCVRDILLGKEPHDYDFCTDAKPEEIKECFKDYPCILTGEKYGTITVRINENNYEITTFRIDGTYEDGRHPKNVFFTDSLYLDLARRDFTMNAMAYHPTQGLVDPFHGKEDLKKKEIRAVGSPYERFQEDPLRILRALRFACTMDYQIEQTTQDAMLKIAPSLYRIAHERIYTEFVKLLTGVNPGTLLKTYPVMKYVIRVWYQINKGFTYLDREKTGDLDVKLVALFFELPTKEVSTILKSLRFDRKTMDHVTQIHVYLHNHSLSDSETKIRHGLSILGPELFRKYLYAYYAVKNRSVKHVEEILDRILKRGDCYNRSMLAITGNDLLNAGIDSGKIIGMILDQLLNHVMEYPEENTKDKLIEYVREKRMC